MSPLSASRLPTGPAGFAGLLRDLGTSWPVRRTVSCSSSYNPVAMLRYLIPTLALVATLPLAAQQPAAAPPALTAADYARAEKFMGYNTTPLVLHSAGRATWLGEAGDERFWYRVTTEKGAEAVLVNPVDGSRSPCDMSACRQALREGGGGRGGGAPQGREARSPDGTSAGLSREWHLW